MTAYFEIVHRDDGHLLRLKGANHEIVMSSELYEDYRSALHAISVAGSAFGLTSGAVQMMLRSTPIPDGLHTEEVYVKRTDERTEK